MANPIDKFSNIRRYAKNSREQYLNFSSEHMPIAENYYVAWIDLMGAGHAMSTSVQKSANFLARLHMAAYTAQSKCGFKGDTLPINDGIFIISKTKKEIASTVGYIMIMLSCNFIAVPRPHDRFLLRGGIAFGPVHFGNDLIGGIKGKKIKENSKFMERIMFGPALIQAYKAETNAPPYGIAIHESARAFCPSGEEPFRMTHWMWWAASEITYPGSLPPLTSLKELLSTELQDHFEWLEGTAIYHGIDNQKITSWKNSCKQYFKTG